MPPPDDLDKGLRAEIRTMRMACSVELAVLAPAAASPAPALLLALHGWGQTCGAFAETFASLAERGVLVVAPQAPHPFYVDPARKRVGFSWLTRHGRDTAVADVNRHLERVVEEFAAYPGFGSLFLLGFSQGASMAYRFAMETSRPVAGVIACGADLPGDVAANLHTRPPLRVLLVHGLRDRIVPPGAMTEAQAVLAHAHYPVETFVHQGGHRLGAKAVARIADWMAVAGPQTNL